MNAMCLNAVVREGPGVIRPARMLVLVHSTGHGMWIGKTLQQVDCAAMKSKHLYLYCLQPHTPRCFLLCVLKLLFAPIDIRHTLSVRDYSSSCN